MRVMKLIQVEIPNGEVVTFRQMDDGTFCCPVCGLGGATGPSWDPPTDDGGDATPTLDTCPCCNTEYGFDDGIGPASPIGQQEENWRRLCIEWLVREKWSDSAVNQLENLGINSEEVAECRRHWLREQEHRQGAAQAKSES